MTESPIVKSEYLGGGKFQETHEDGTTTLRPAGAYVRAASAAVGHYRNRMIRRIAAIKCMAAKELHAMELEQHLAKDPVNRGYFVRTGKRIRDKRRA